MIKHVLMIKLKNRTNEQMLSMKEMLLSMNEKVDVVKQVNVGIDFLNSPRSYDILLEVILDNKELLDDYQKDEYHHEVVKPYVVKNSESIITVDYEF